MNIHTFLSKYEIDDLLELEGVLEKKEEYEVFENICSVENLTSMHNNSKLLFPSYLLRFGTFDETKKQSENTLKVLLEAGSFMAYEEMKGRYGRNLSKAPDEFLVIGAQTVEGFNERDLLTEIYSPIIEKIINRIDKRYYFRGQERDDLKQEALLGFLKAIEVYKIERRTKFRDFTRNVIERHLGTLMNRSKNLRNRALNESFSYNMPVNTNNETTFEDLLEGDPILPEEIFLKSEMYKEIKEKLTENENEVLEPYSKGYTYEEIAFSLIEKKSLLDFRGLNYTQVSTFLKVVEYLSKDNKGKELDEEMAGMIGAIQSNLEYQFDGEIHYLCGFTYEHIAKVIKRRKKSVDNTIQRIRIKGVEHRYNLLNEQL